MNLTEYQENNESQINEMLDFLSLCARDCSIREELTVYDAVRFIQLMKRNHPKFTLSDVKQMFEAYVSDEIDNAEPHYGRFSAKFYLSVARQYASMKLKQPPSVKMITEPTEPTEEQKKELLKEFERIMINAFDTFTETGVVKGLDSNYPVYKYWKEKGFIQEAVMLPEDVSSAVRLMGKMSERDKELEGMKQAYRRLVLDFYTKTLEKGEHIKDYIR